MCIIDTCTSLGTEVHKKKFTINDIYATCNRNYIGTCTKPRTAIILLIEFQMFNYHVIDQKLYLWYIPKASWLTDQYKFTIDIKSVSEKYLLIVFLSHSVGAL